MENSNHFVAKIDRDTLVSYKMEYGSHFDLVVKIDRLGASPGLHQPATDATEVLAIPRPRQPDVDDVDYADDADFLATMATMCSTVRTFFAADDLAADVVWAVLVSHLLIEKQKKWGMAGEYAMSYVEEDLYFELIDEAKDEADEKMLALRRNSVACRAFVAELLGEQVARKIYTYLLADGLAALGKVEVMIASDIAEVNYKEIPAVVLAAAGEKLLREFSKHHENWRDADRWGPGAVRRWPVSV